MKSDLDKIKNLDTLYFELEGGGHREATPEEINLAILVREKYEELKQKFEWHKKNLEKFEKKNSDLKVFYDEPGFINDVRHYIALDEKEFI